jgi:hypothetical protein
MSTLSGGPNIVTDGLILNLDAANTKSYPGSGTTWTDLSRAGNIATLVNGPTFNSANGGSIVFDGTDDVVTVPMTNLRPTTGITQEVVVYIQSNELQVWIGSQYGVSSNNSYALWLDSTSTLACGVNIGGTLNYQTQSYTITIDKYYHFIHTYNGSTQKLYANGIEIRSWSTSGNIAYDSNNTLLAIGNDWNGSGYNTGAGFATHGNQPIVKIYNRALTASEVLQNYNATKTRFGL